MFYVAYVNMLRILFLFISCSCVLAQDAISVDKKMDVFRLPNNTEPISYNLKITPRIDPLNDDFTFSGIVTINILVKLSTKVLTLNADSLKIQQIDIKDQNSSTSVEVIDNKFIVKNEQLEIQFNEPGLIVDRIYKVQITYTGKLRNDMTGFYKSSYIDQESKTTKWLAVTHFEPTYARRAFPCYDEPAFKTPFLISIIRKDTQISLSNMPVKNIVQVTSSDSTNYVCDEYFETKPMSTYLVAFSVSEFVNATNSQKVFVYTHKEYIDQVTYIAEKGNKLLNLMEIYTNIQYPFSKMDLLAVPDFSMGAMENWGLNTYREKYLLVSEKSSEKDKELVTTVVQHELSHQWFGNLVTCSWWNYVWLNEAFATLFEYFAVDVAEPDWRIADMFVIEQHQVALAYDHRPRHPITASVNTPDEIDDIFDTITYNKGGSVLRMLSYTLTNDIFRSSLILYLDTYKYKSVEPKNLWDSFDNVIADNEYKLGILGDQITVGEFMNTWTDQAGYPVINVQKNNDDSLSITQKRFEIDVPKINYSTLWHIGLTYTTQKKKEFKNLQPFIWMNNTETKTTIPLGKDEGWVIFNLQSSGFYRVNYDLKNWNLLIAELQSHPKMIHVLNRAQLIDDSFNLARAGELSYSVPFSLISYLEKEDDYIPWYSVISSMTYLVERSRSCSHTGPQVQEFTKKQAEIAYQKVSYLYEEKKNDQHLKKTSMKAFSNWACKLEVDSCIKSAKSYFNNWLNGIEIPPEKREATLCIGVKNGDEETWNRIFKLFVETNSTSERQAALLALACSTNAITLSNYLDILLTGEKCPIRSQDYYLVFKSLVSTPTGINVTIEFLKNKINESLSTMWGGEDTIALMYKTLASSVALRKEINELNAIRNFTYLSPKLKESFNNSYKEVELNSAYFERCHPLLHNWFNPPSKPSTGPFNAASNLFTNINVIILQLLFITILLKNNYLLVI